MTKKVLIVAPVHEVLVQELEKMGYTCDLKEELTQTEAVQIIADYEGLVTSTRLFIDQVFMDQAVQLKWIGRMGSGMEIVDTAYAAEKGIQCFSSPEGNANAVAEQALGMLLSLQHKITSAYMELQQGLWRREENRGIEIEGLTAGVIGYGHNGSAFAAKLKAMNVRVLALDKYKTGYGENGIEECSGPEQICAQADIISFHLPLNTETHHYFNDRFLEQVQKPFVLLNLSRGNIVSQETLYRGLKSGKIKGAALDVWEAEPVSKMKGTQAAMFEELIRMPQFIGTPHIAGYTVQALYKMSHVLAAKIKSAFLLS